MIAQCVHAGCHLVFLRYCKKMLECLLLTCEVLPAKQHLCSPCPFPPVWLHLPWNIHLRLHDVRTRESSCCLIIACNETDRRSLWLFAMPIAAARPPAKRQLVAPGYIIIMQRVTSELCRAFAMHGCVSDAVMAWRLTACAACRYYALNWGCEEEKVPCQQKILAYEQFLHSRSARHCFVCMGPNQEPPNSDAWDRKVLFMSKVPCTPI